MVSSVRAAWIETTAERRERPRRERRGLDVRVVDGHVRFERCEVVEQFPADGAQSDEAHLGVVERSDVGAVSVPRALGHRPVERRDRSQASEQQRERVLGGVVGHHVVGADDRDPGVVDGL